MSLRKRTSTAVVLLVIIFACIQYSSDLVYFIVIQALVLASLWEFYNLASRKKHAPQRILGFSVALIIAFSFYFEAFPLEVALFVALLICGVYYVLAINKLEKLMSFPPSVALTFFGAFIVSFPLNHFIYLRQEHGPNWIYFLLAVIFVGDTGSYIIGKPFGRHKLAPLASPHKTWEGSVAGVVFACLAGILARQIFLPEVLLWKAAVFAFIVHVAAQFSDPLESLFKRAVGVKDSSNILPGHGGFFDRIDSMILAAPFYYYMLKYIGMY
ncbi:MAG: phosphatidate cytidylyltransferase [Candidatus Aminicenantes bacterium]|nr:MAG: phosphatidate cytidylyltransferase [Candidatus Aminicenantes bacterium]